MGHRPQLWAVADVVFVALALKDSASSLGGSCRQLALDECRSSPFPRLRLWSGSSLCPEHLGQCLLILQNPA